MSHTPGPWYTCDDEIFKDIKDKRYSIAKLESWSEETEFNARLIAASPDLLAALKDLVKRCDGPEGVMSDGSNIDTAWASAIIAKAQGAITESQGTIMRTTLSAIVALLVAIGLFSVVSVSLEVSHKTHCVEIQ